MQSAIVLIADAVAAPVGCSLSAMSSNETTVNKMTETLSFFRSIKNQAVMN